jgi:SAM-dependent methyltransferase
VTLEPRERWIKAAAGWERRADQFGRDTMPVSAWMVEAIGPQPGHTVLELAAGTGDTGFLAAELIDPGGTLITSDFAPEMLAAAQRRAQTKGVANVRFRQMDINVPLDQPAASVDGVLGRWVFMLIHDAEAALREARRILRPNGRVALAAWTDADENVWSSAPVKTLQKHGVLEPDPPGPGQFHWASPHLIAETLEAAGFLEPDVQAIEFHMHYQDFDDWWTAVTLQSTRIGEADRTMDFATRSDVLAELEPIAERFEQPDGSLHIPARTWVAAATA